jgi:hypothetical protein
MIIIGPEVSTEADIEFWMDYMYSKPADSKTGGTVANYNPGAAAKTVLESGGNIDIGPVISFYDPEIQALLAFE